MVSVQKIVSYYTQFFQTVIYDQVKHSEKIMTEWQYFNQLLWKEPIDYNRIQTYLDIISLNNKQQDLSQKSKQANTPTSQQMNYQNQMSQSKVKLKLNTEENIDTDFDESDNSPSSKSSCSDKNRERQVLVFKNEDDEEEFDDDNQENQQDIFGGKDNQNIQQLLEGEEEFDQDNIMIIERKCFDDELNSFQQNPIYTSTSPTIKKSSEKNEYKKSSQSKINQFGMVLTPNTSKNIQQQKFSFYSNEQTLKTHESSNSPILKEVTSNFQNIKTISNYSKSSQQQAGFGKQLSNNLNSQFSQNQQNSHNHQNNENIFASQNEVSKNYNINFKISPQLSKENSNQQTVISSIDVQKQQLQQQQQQQQQFSSSFSSKNNKVLTPSLSHFSITNKSLKNILQETSQHTKSLEQNIEMIDAQPNSQLCVIAAPLATEQGSGYKKKNMSKQLNYNNNNITKIESHNQIYNKVENKHLKTLPSPAPVIFNAQPPVQPICHTSNSQSSIKDFIIQDIENKEQQFQQVSQNQEFESVSERKSQIKTIHNKTPFQESINQPLMNLKPPFTPTEDNKMKREFNNLYLRKHISDVVTFFEGNNKKIDDILDKIQNNQQHQQQGYLQYQQSFSNHQLGLVGGQQQFHRLGLSSNQMTPQSLNGPNYSQLPAQNYQPFPQVTKQASQIQLFFQPTPPPAPPLSAHQIQNQQSQQIQQLYGFQQNQQHQQINTAFQQYQQRSVSQHNGVSNLYQQQAMYPPNFIQQNNQQQLQQFSNITQINRQNAYQPPLIPIKQTSCPRGSSENSGGRSLSTYSRDTSDGQVKTMFKRMRTYDICTSHTQNSSQAPSNLPQKNLNRTMDENINNSNNVSCMNLNTSKLNPNQTTISNANNVSCNLNYSNNENNRYLTNSTNQIISTSNQNSSQELQQRKRSEYSFPDLKSFNKYIKK